LPGFAIVTCVACCSRAPTLPARSARASAKIARQLRLLRAHGLIQKVPKSHRGSLTQKGSLLAAALFAAHRSTRQQLLRNAT
jgi:hypothetical protein